MSKRNGGGAIRTLLVAASAVRRAGLETLLQASPDLKLVGSLQSAASLPQQVRDLQPDVVVVDLGQGNRGAVPDSGIGGMPLVMLVDDPDPIWSAQALRSGVRAILPRDVDSDEILSAIQAVLRGLVLLDSELATELAIQIRQPAVTPEVALETLTPRELEVLRMLAEGLGNRQMAAHLGISDHTVKFHISSILDKLGAATRTEAVTMGIRMGVHPAVTHEFPAAPSKPCRNGGSMTRHSRLSIWLGTILGALCTLALASAPSFAQEDHRAFTEEFHQTYPLSAGGRIELENINGPVHITAWDRNEVKVDAVKYASRQERLADAKIEVEAGSDYVSIHTQYRDHDLTFNDHDHNNPASVEYTLSVPRSARLDEIKLVNGALDISGVGGEVRASCINGRLKARDLQGRAELSTVNGHLEAQFAQLSNSPVDLSSVNGGLDVTLPSDSKAELEASTVHGGIENDFGLRVRNHQYVGHDLRGELAGGGTRIKLSNVNGHIEIHHASDGRSLSPATDRNAGKDSDRNDSDDDDDDSI